MRIHAVLEVERRREVDIVEQREVAADWYRVVPAVVPVLDKVRVQQLVLLRVDAVRDVTRVRHRDLLVPTLVANGVLAFERIEA